MRVFTRVAKPGEPSYSLVIGHTVYVGTFEDVAGDDSSPSKVFAYSSSGKRIRTYLVRGQTPGAAHGVQVAARDHKGRLYLLDQSPARVIVMNRHSGHQRTWATFADVKPCSAGQSANCSNTAADNPPEPDYAAWLPDGSLLVSDYAQQLIWRIPPHGRGVRKATVWLNDKRLDGEEFGPAGLVMMPSHHSLLLTVATGGVTTVDPAENSTKGRLYRIDLTAHHHVERLVRLWSSEPGEAPDGFAVSRHHTHVYIAMAGPAANHLVELARSHSGVWKRVLTVPSSGHGASTASTWDTPTSVSFLGTRLLVTNQAYFSDNSSHWLLFDVASHDHGQPLYVPKHAGS